MSSISTSSLSESSDFVEYSQAQSSTVSPAEHAEMKRKVYMRKKDRKACGSQQNSFKSVNESSDSDSSPTNLTSSSLKSCKSSYGSCNSTLLSEMSSPIPCDSNSSEEYKSSFYSSDNSHFSSDDVIKQSRPKETLKTPGRRVMEEQWATENLFNPNCIAEDIKLYNEAKERMNQDHLKNVKPN